MRWLPWWVLVVATGLASGCRTTAVYPLDGIESPDPGIRVRAIRQIVDDPVRSKSPEAKAALVDRLDDEDEAVRFFAIAALDRLTGQRFGYRAYDPPEERRRAVARWRRSLGTGTPRAEEAP